MARLLRTLGSLILTTGLLLSAGCQREPSSTLSPHATTDSPVGLTQVSLQLDWFPEPAHGGFFQAAERGFYAEVGLDVQLIPGGPGGRPTQKVAAGQVPFSMGRSDDVMLAVQQGLPVLIVAALMQHDPQALLLHADNPISTFADLDGHALMASPGSAWIPYLQKRHGINIDLMPMSFGLARFIADPTLIQACFITDEPFRLQQRGITVKTLLLADSGYDPYRVIIAHRPYAEAHPTITRAFVAATLRGWDDYLHGDPTPAHTRIALENEHMSPAQLDYSRTEMLRQHFVTGDPSLHESISHLDPARLRSHATLLHELGVLSHPLRLEDYATTDYLP
ncbi:MAG: ABC transporter substrate-binding protein [Candidatus Synoicihabitans palmerolidicus]|nr:ABC transporter substrate-binding protein [Candidatus Synoicihabitans palmerolidicus]